MKRCEGVNRRWMHRALAAAAIWVACFQGPSFVRSLQPQPSVNLGDFFQEWASAKNWRAGFDVYDDQELALTRWMGIQLGKDDRLVIRRNAHPPFSIVLTIWSAWMDYLPALLVWHGIVAVCIIGAVVAMLKELRISVRLPTLLSLAVLSLALNPIRQQFNQGQWNGVLLLLLTAAWLAVRRGWHGWFGGLIGLAGAIKLFPLYLILVPLAIGRWKSAVMAAVVFSFCNGFAAVVLGMNAIAEYAQVVPELRRFQPFWINYSIPGLAARITGAAFPIGAAITAILLTPLFATEFFRWRRIGRVDLDSVFCGSLVAMALTSPLSWDHGLILITPPILVWSMRSASQSPAVACFLWCSAAIASTNLRLIFESLFGTGCVERQPGNWIEWIASSVALASLLGIYAAGIACPGRCGNVRTDAASSELNQ